MDQQIQPPSSVTIVEPPKPTFTIPMTIFLALFLGLGLASFIFHKPEDVSQLAVVDEFADWKTYRNEEYGFQLSLTDSWKGYIVENTGQQLEFKLPTTADSLNPYRLLIIATTTKEIWNDYLTCDCPRPSYISEKDGVVFVHWQSQDPPVELDKQYFEIEQILSTFKFINTSTPDISTWKTYRNEAYGFEFKYPENYVYKSEFVTVPYENNAKHFVLSLNIKDPWLTESGAMYLEIDPLGSDSGVECEDWYTEKNIIRGIDFERNESQDCGLISYKFSLNGRSYYAWINSVSFDEILFDKILSTFKFTK